MKKDIDLVEQMNNDAMRLVGGDVVDQLEARLSEMEVEDFVDIYEWFTDVYEDLHLNRIYSMMNAEDWAIDAYNNDAAEVIRNISDPDVAWDWNDEWIGKGEYMWFTFTDMTDCIGLIRDFAQLVWDNYLPEPTLWSDREKAFWEWMEDKGLLPSQILHELASGRTNELG